MGDLQARWEAAAPREQQAAVPEREALATLAATCGHVTLCRPRQPRLPQVPLTSNAEGAVNLTPLPHTLVLHCPCGQGRVLPSGRFPSRAAADSSALGPWPGPAQGGMEACTSATYDRGSACQPAATPPWRQAHLQRVALLLWPTGLHTGTGCRVFPLVREQAESPACPR